uniref:Bromo domain-containing protein n=1 Tax=Oryza rufipogon TaxID=4529 RepID=A0A0E0Q9Z5_ORYRU
MVVVVVGGGGGGGGGGGVKKEEGEEEARGRGGGGGVVGGWGTWEELVLGSAVIRHGGVAWGAVAAEVRSRSPCAFSPEECEAKFSEIQARYSACDAWFEELRKRRVAELRNDLKKSENFIGSLQSMIKSLSNSKHDDGNSECHTSHTESCSNNENTADNNSSSKALSKDRSSAASFTEEASNSQKSEKVQHCDTDSIQVNNTSAETLVKPLVEKKVCAEDGLLWGSRKKRAVRDRRTFLMADNSCRAGENTSTSHIQTDGSSEGYAKKGLKTPNLESGVSVVEKAKPNLAEILKTISTQSDCYMLQRRLDVQRKRTRYKKMIRRHIDFRILHSKIKSGATSSTKELLRDILLFVNNVLAFYPKATLEHMAAIELRNIAFRTVQESASMPSKSCGVTGAATAPLVKKNTRPVQPGSHGPHDAKRSKVSLKGTGSTVKQGEAKGSRGGSSVTANVKTMQRNPPAKKRGVGRPPKNGQKRAAAQQDSPNKGRKRTRR